MDMSVILSAFVGSAYLVVFAAVLLDNAGLPIPGELILLAFGLVARTGQVDLTWGVVAAGLGAMAGDTASYWMGRLGGVRILRAYCRMTLGSGACVEKAVTYYRRFGRVTIIVGRFVIGVRAFLMPLAGSTRLPYGEFLLFDAIGATVWSGFYIGAGYTFSSEVTNVEQGFRMAEVVVGSALALVAFGYLALKLWRRRRYGAGRLEPPGDPPDQPPASTTAETGSSCPACAPARRGVGLDALDGH